MDLKQWFLKYSWAINLLLLALIAYFLADAINNILARKFSPGVAMAQELVMAPPVPDINYRPEVGKIESRDLLRSVTRTVEEPQSGPLDGDTAIEETSLRVELVFITYFSLANPLNRATIKNLKEQKVGLFAVGDTLAEDGVIQEIETDRVLIVRNDGKIEELRIKKSGTRPERPGGIKIGGSGKIPGGKKQSREELMQKITKIGENEYMVEREALEQVLENLDQFVAEAGLRPVYSGFGEERTLDGFKLRMKKGSMVEALGLSQGDVLKSINGSQLSVGAMMQLLESLRDQSSFTLDVERNGEPVQMRYRVQ